MDGSLDGFGGYVSLYAVLGCVRSFSVVLSRSGFFLSSVTFSRCWLFQVVFVVSVGKLRFFVACFWLF